MKKLVFAAVLAAFSTAAVSAQVVLKTKADSVSYAFGLMTGEQMKQQNQKMEGFKPELATQAIAQIFSGQPTAMPAGEARLFYQNYQREMAAKEHEGNKMAGQKFLEENKKKAGVTTTASGLQYSVISKGAGTKKPLPSDKVKVHYHGTLTDGTVFDSSVDRGTPAEFGVTQVIKGWVEGLQLMDQGDKFKFYIPYDLAYGERAAGAKIKPYSALLFEVELLEIKEGPKPAAAPTQIAPATKQ